MPNERFRVTTTMPGMKDKIQIKILDGNTDRIYWYIKFNLQLDKTSVTNKTMQVTDTDGYIMRTYIAYDTNRHVIVVSPIDSYMENKYYILGISKDVRSESGQNLKKEIYVLFKLINNEISKFEVLKSTARIPVAKQRPPDYDENLIKVYSFSKKSNEQNTEVGKDLLNYQDVKINIILAVLGVPVIGGGFFLEEPMVMGGGAALCLIGMGIILKQMAVKANRSNLTYNMGVFHFNRGRYQKAKFQFQKALLIDEENEQAEYAITKVGFYI